MKYLNKALISLISVAMMAVAAGCCTTQTERHEVVTTVNSADESPIVYGVRGEGDITVVFIHCWTCNHEFWRPQIEAFAHEHRVVWMDLAEHGISGSQRTQYTMSAFGEDVAAVVREINAEKVILVGHSMGGPVAIEAAKNLGDRVIGIVGVDTFYTPFEYPKSETAINEFVKPFRDDFKSASENLVRSMFKPSANPEQVTSIVDQMSIADPQMGVSAMYEIFKWNAQNTPSALDAYSDILWNINAEPTENTQATNDRVILIPGAGHFVPQVKPKEFNIALKRIISTLQTR
jgi:pimeloyl-ACP methyl ester carboxylesterase